MEDGAGRSTSLRASAPASVRAFTGEGCSDPGARQSGVGSGWPGAGSGRGGRLDRRWGRRTWIRTRRRVLLSHLLPSHRDAELKLPRPGADLGDEPGTSATAESASRRGLAEFRLATSCAAPPAAAGSADAAQASREARASSPSPSRCAARHRPWANRCGLTFGQTWRTSPT